MAYHGRAKHIHQLTAEAIPAGRLDQGREEELTRLMIALVAPEVAEWLDELDRRHQAWIEAQKREILAELARMDQEGEKVEQRKRELRRNLILVGYADHGQQVGEVYEDERNDDEGTETEARDGGGSAGGSGSDGARGRAHGRGESTGAMAGGQGEGRGGARGGSGDPGCSDGDLALSVGQGSRIGPARRPGRFGAAAGMERGDVVPEQDREVKA